ncbi:MAG TPA: dihydroneopterin aldolase [Candidatus Saccharimonadales bacterium]|nr:dihydroneopterin aldolase [Candidatus Saccharimonadales bacterium]
MKNTIKLIGIKAEGKHGANPGEQDSPQVFIADLEIKLETSGDALEQTVDYEKLTGIAKEQIKNQSYKLIETLAYNIASEISKLERVEKVSVSIHKPSAAKNMGVDDVIARVELEKEG